MKTEHYVGPLDFIGLPGYELRPEGVVKTDTQTLQATNPPKRRMSYAFQIADGVVKMSPRKLIWCADHGVHYKKSKEVGVVVLADGSAMGRADYCRWLNDNCHPTIMDVKVPKDEQLRRLNVTYKECEILREAVTTSDYSKVAAYVATLEDAVMTHVWTKASHFNKAKREAIWHRTFDEMMLRIKNGTVCGESIARVAKNVARTITNRLNNGDGKGGIIRTINKVEYKLHNEDDEMPYVYD